MVQKKTIAIVGATGKRGAYVARSLASSSHRLLLMSEDTEKLSALKIELSSSSADVETISCAKDACWEADIIIVATPFAIEKETAEKIREVATGKIVISVSDLIEASVYDLAVPHHSSAAEELQRLLPYSKVVKTFNTALSTGHLRPTTKAPDTFIAGNNGDAVSEVFELVRSAGLNPFIVGDLSTSRAMERMQLVTKHNLN